MFKGTKDKIRTKTESPQSHLLLLGVASFLESTVIPIPLETVLIPYYYTHRQQLWRAATVVTVTCLMGASAFYWVGGIAMDGWGEKIISWFSDESSFESLKASLNEKGFLLILLAGITPIPFQIAMLAAGAVEYSFGLFIVAATLARGLRYYGLAFLVKQYGDDALEMWQHNKLKASAISVLILVAIYGVGRWLQSLAGV